MSEFLTKLFKMFDNKIVRKLEISCVDAHSGEYHLFNESTVDPVKAVVSSASIPFVFPDNQWHDVWDNGVICIDGGSAWNTNLASAI